MGNKTEKKYGTENTTYIDKFIYKMAYIKITYIKFLFFSQNQIKLIFLTIYIY